MDPQAILNLNPQVDRDRVAKYLQFVADMQKLGILRPSEYRIEHPFGGSGPSRQQPRLDNFAASQFRAADGREQATAADEQ
jgi:hypothetical protein